MLTGMPPFYSKNRDKLFKTIKAGLIKYPKYLSKNAVSLLESLFIQDPDKRLGSGPDGVNNIKNHPFFSSIDWDAILNMKIKPPFTPKIRSDADVRYIDPEFTNCTPVDSYNPNDNIVDSEYIDFTYDPKKDNGVEE